MNNHTINIETYYAEQSIQPCSGGYGEYQTQPMDSDWYADKNDLLNDCINTCTGTIYSLDDADLPECVDDIRGRIHNEEGDIYAVVYDDDNVSYFAVVESERYYCPLCKTTHNEDHLCENIQEIITDLYEGGTTQKYDETIKSLISKFCEDSND